MKLTVRRPGHIPIRIVLPTSLLSGRVSAAILAQALRQQEISVPAEVIRAQLRSLPWREWRGLSVVEAEMQNGISVHLTL